MKKIAFFIAGLVGAMLCFDIALRIIEITPAWKILPVAEVSPYGPDEISGYTHRPGVHGIWAAENRARVSISPEGYRTSHVVPDAAFKVAFIGDSVTESLQVSDGEDFPALVGKKLKASSYNLGLAGATPAVMAARAMRFGEALKPDIIIILIDPESLMAGLDDAQGGRLPYYKNNGGKIETDRSFLESGAYKFRTSAAGRIVYWLMNHSRALTVLNNRLNRGLFEEWKNQTAKSNTQAKPKQCFEKTLKVLSTLPNAENVKRRNLLAAFMKDLQAVEKKTKAKIEIAFYDTANDCPAALERNGYAGLRNFGERYGIRVVNFKEALQKHLPKGSRLDELRGFGTKKGYGHLNHAGHEIFAETFADVIKE